MRAFERPARRRSIRFLSVRILRVRCDCRIGDFRRRLSRSLRPEASLLMLSWPWAAYISMEVRQWLRWPVGSCSSILDPAIDVEPRPSHVRAATSPPGVGSPPPLFLRLLRRSGRASTHRSRRARLRDFGLGAAATARSATITQCRACACRRRRRAHHRGHPNLVGPRSSSRNGNFGVSRSPGVAGDGGSTLPFTNS